MAKISTLQLFREVKQYGNKIDFWDKEHIHLLGRWLSICNGWNVWGWHAADLVSKITDESAKLEIRLMFNPEQPAGVEGFYAAEITDFSDTAYKKYGNSFSERTILKIQSRDFKDIKNWLQAYNVSHNYEITPEGGVGHHQEGKIAWWYMKGFNIKLIRGKGIPYKDAAYLH